MFLPPVDHEPPFILGSLQLSALTLIYCHYSPRYKRQRFTFYVLAFQLCFGSHDIWPLADRVSTWRLVELLA